MRRFAYAIVALALLQGCGDATTDSKPPGTGPLSVYVVNYPLGYFAERVGGDLVEVHFPVPTDEDPAYWSPEPNLIASYQGADLILLNGADYAKWLNKVSLPASKLVDTSRSFSDQYIELEEETTHSHGPEGEHAHAGWAFTTWLDLELAIEQARAVKTVLAVALPEYQARFDSRYAELESELLEVHNEIERLVASNPELPVVFSHPVYQYFQRRYNLNGRSVHWEPDEMPSEEMWAQLEALLAEHPARWMIWEDTPLREIELWLESLGIRSQVFDPCARTPFSGDFLAVMEKNLQMLGRVFAAESLGDID